MDELTKCIKHMNYIFIYITEINAKTKTQVQKENEKKR